MATRIRRRAAAILAPLVIGVLGAGLATSPARAETVPTVPLTAVTDASGATDPSLPAPAPIPDPTIPAPTLGDRPGNAPLLFDWWW